MLKTFYRAARKFARPVKRAWMTRSNSKVFTEVYEKRLWGGKDSEDYFSGPGSYHSCVPEYVEAVKSIIKSHNIRSVMEVGCGDFTVARQYVDVCETYLGLDVVKGLIERNTTLFGNYKTRFVCCDASKQKLEPVDLCIVRQVFQHLSNKDILRILANITAKVMLITEHLPESRTEIAINVDKQSGGDVRIHYGSGVFIDQPPFCMNATVLLDRPFEPSGTRIVTWVIYQNSTNHSLQSTSKPYDRQVTLETSSVSSNKRTLS